LTGHKSVSWVARAAADLAVFNLQNLIVGIQIGAILLVGGFGILAAQIMMVMQKTRDISILRSIGLRRRDIVALFVTQGALIALLGGLFGDLVAWGLTSYLASLIDPSQPYSDAALYICKDPPSYAVGLVFALLVGTLASALPAWRGARVEPVAVLRGSIG
ncbi:MAG TPA: FtsX-like permease family protein, partial [Polyangia bacterium]|nr:FtsX-like permease family protein [Polyangia bacterium]